MHCYNPSLCRRTDLIKENHCCNAAYNHRSISCSRKHALGIAARDQDVINLSVECKHAYALVHIYICVLLIIHAQSCMIAGVAVDVAVVVGLAVIVILNGSVDSYAESPDVHM